MKKAYLTFQFEGFEAVGELHCTHAYFGKVSDADIEAIKTDLAAHFRASPWRDFEAVFDKPVLLGPNQDITGLSARDVALFRPTLREELMERANPNAPKYAGYLPHVTTPEEGPLKFKVVNLFLIVSKQPAWSAK